jgi:hypothetical protein
MGSVTKPAGAGGAYTYTLSAVPLSPPVRTIFSDSGRTTVVAAAEELTAGGSAVQFTGTYPLTLPAGRYFLRHETLTAAGVVLDDDDELVLTSTTGSVHSGYLTLEQVKDHLRETSAAQDQRLPRYIAAAERMVHERCGHVLPAPYVEDVDVHRVQRLSHLTVNELPVLDVQSVLLAPDGRAVPAGDAIVGVDGWVLQDPRSGVLELHGHHGPRARVTYRAGRTAVPELLVTATLDLVQHLWRSSQNRVGPGQQGVFTGRSPDESRPYPAGFAMPRAVAEMLEPELLPGIIG